MTYDDCFISKSLQIAACVANDDTCLRGGSRRASGAGGRRARTAAGTLSPGFDLILLQLNAQL